MLLAGRREPSGCKAIHPLPVELPQRHARSSRLLPSDLPGPRPRAQGHGSERLLCHQYPRRGARPGAHAPVFLLDEAHLLHQDVLEHLHILANYEWNSKPLLSLVLVGLPELWGKLTLAKNRSLWSRVHVRLSLGEAKPEDTNEYIEHRLKAAGTTRAVFSSDALVLVHEATQGRLRDIDRIATHALKRAARRKLKIVDRELLGHVLDEDSRPDLR